MDMIARGLALKNRVIGQSAVAVSTTGDTVEHTLATITIPAGAMGANGRIVIEALFSMTNSANSKTLKFKFGSLVALNMSVTATGGGGYRRTITNRGAANSQVTQNATANASDIVSAGGAPLTGAIDTTASVDIAITGQLALGTETITLESYQVILYARG